jgi:hypothetical protein
VDNPTLEIFPFNTHILDMEAPVIIDRAALEKVTAHIKEKLSREEYAELENSLNFVVYPLKIGVRNSDQDQ